MQKRDKTTRGTYNFIKLSEGSDSSRIFNEVTSYRNDSMAMGVWVTLTIHALKNNGTFDMEEACEQISSLFTHTPRMIIADIINHFAEKGIVKYSEKLQLWETCYKLQDEIFTSSRRADIERKSRKNSRKNSTAVKTAKSCENATIFPKNDEKVAKTQLSEKKEENPIPENPESCENATISSKNAEKVAKTQLFALEPSSITPATPESCENATIDPESCENATLTLVEEAESCENATISPKNDEKVAKTQLFEVDASVKNPTSVGFSPSDKPKEEKEVGKKEKISQDTKNNKYIYINERNNSETEKKDEEID